MFESQDTSSPSSSLSSSPLSTIHSIICFAKSPQSYPPISTDLNDITHPFQTATTATDATVVNAINNTEDNSHWPNHASDRNGNIFPNTHVENTQTLNQYLKAFIKGEVQDRRMKIAKGLKIVTKPIRRILSMVEEQEPRFKCSFFDPLSEPMKREIDDVILDYFRLNEEMESESGEIGFDRLSNNGIKIISSREFEFLLYLGHSGTFTMYELNRPIENHQTDQWTYQNVRSYPQFNPLQQQGVYGIPGTAALKLSDGRKRSMSLWVEFITASGFLSAKKMRTKFRQLVIQALDKLTEKEKKVIRLEGQEDRDGGEGVVLVVKETYRVTLALSFRCENSWPRSASSPHQFTSSWQREIKSRGFDLVSKKVIHLTGSNKPFPHLPHHPSFQFSNETAQISNEDDVWQISFDRIQSLLLYQNVSPGKSYCLEILKTLMDNHCHHIEDRPVDISLLENLVLYEFEKHPKEDEWLEVCIGERLIGIMLQLIACLRNRSCLLYFMRRVDLLRFKIAKSLDLASVEIWKLQRQFVFMNKNINYY